MGTRSSNDDRSDSLNPNNDASRDSLDNHADQMNPNSERFGGSHQHDDDDEE